MAPKQKRSDKKGSEKVKQIKPGYKQISTNSCVPPYLARIKAYEDQLKKDQAAKDQPKENDQE